MIINEIRGKKMNPIQRIIAIFILLFSFTISSCSPSLLPTATEIPPTETAIPTNTPQPTQKPTETPTLIPALSNWNGIPIIPDAIAGKEEMGDYQFTSKSSAKIIRTYYEQEMIKLGWVLRTDMVPPNNPDFCFSKDNTFAFFLIQTEGNNSVVYIHPVQNTSE
jgi:hypothetical protein